MSTIQTSGGPSDMLRARAYARMVEQQKLATMARLSRARSRNLRLAIMATTVLGSLLAVALYFGLTVPSAPPTPKVLDPSTKRFITTKTGQIRTPLHGNKCRELAFDNQTGIVSNETVVACDEDLPFPSGEEKNSGSRFNNIRDSLR